MVCAVDQCLPGFFSFLVLKSFVRFRGIVLGGGGGGVGGGGSLGWRVGGRVNWEGGY